MKKVLLIEDRDIRQEYFFKETKIDLKRYDSILDNCIRDCCNSILDQIENNNLDFSGYDYIIIHKSIFNYHFIDTIKEYCKTTNKPLVLFSGGISANYYDTKELELLEINSKVLYSKNFELFLEAIFKNEENILMLCYGKQWQQNVVSSVIEQMNIFIDNQNEDDIVEYSNFTLEVDVSSLKEFENEIYEMQVDEDGWVYLNEIKKLRDSLYKCLKKTYANYVKVQSKKRSILVHSNNVTDLQLFDKRLKFLPNISDVDEYISKTIIPELNKQDYDMIFIKDNLSSFNYLELYGIRLAYHIRLSHEMKNKRFCPIVIISDLNTELLNRINSIAKILFTKNIYIVKNMKYTIKRVKNLNFLPLNYEDYQRKFLEHIDIEPPKDYLSHHDISNEWAIYRWANFLGVESEAIEKIQNKISSMLYFKYLLAKNPLEENDALKLKQKLPTLRGKIIYIDDEWAKGWSDIFDNYFQKIQNIVFDTFKYDYKDKLSDEIIEGCVEFVEKHMPDIVILDLRLSQSDHEVLENFTGIKVLRAIHEINPGIQVIMLSATGKSVILEQLYKEKILGYIKKEHPNDVNIKTQDNLKKLNELLKIGFDRSYLKEVYTIKDNVYKTLEYNPFNRYEISFQNTDYLALLKKNTKYIFDILDTNMQNKYNYAMVTIATSLETVVKIFLYKKTQGNQLYFWDGEEAYNLYENSILKDKILKIIKSKLGYNNTDISLENLIKHRNSYMHSNKNYKEVSKEKILEWFKIYSLIIDIINNPPNYKIYDKDKKKISKHHNFFKKDKEL